MKVLIVDDERHVREAIRYFIPWDEHGISEIYEATNGQEAIEIIEKQRPAVIFTDMKMPLLDGAELLEWLHKHSPNTKTIVISGYQDFSYVKPAIVYGGTDYLLKPLNSKQLIAAAERAFEMWRKEEQERELLNRQNIQLNVLRPLYWDKALTDLVSGTRSYQELAGSLSEELGLLRGTETCRIAVISLKSANCRLLQRFHGDLQLTSFVLANVCNEVISPRRSGYAFRYWLADTDIVVLFWNTVEEAENWVLHMNESIQQTYGIQLDIGLSAINAFPSQLPNAFRQARQGLSGRNILQNHGRIHLYREELDDVNTKADLSLPAELEKFRISVLSGEMERMYRAVDDWAEYISSATLLTESSIQRWEEEIGIILTRWSKEQWGDERFAEESIHFAPCYDAEGLFSVEAWRDQLKALLLKLSKEGGLTQSTDSKIILEIRSYLDQHYQQDMTLQHIAERFYISRENVSRKFKQVIGENLSDYLTNLRVDKAKVLLQNTNMRLSQISELVGYEDEKYFSRVFKKATGQTPREYRKQ
ncbi:response regulator [Paenibacillus wynnii]|uniref:response regulator n=1 Tax=Paenibacillus wynnii TaxID=268407 RepID=UPI0027933F19|nr:response regulator [Paenibacillus wynnii]MDQ0196455.1 two-component system response regulator YesN [Paenibacillus wynnii]